MKLIIRVWRVSNLIGLIGEMAGRFRGKYEMTGGFFDVKKPRKS
jgi:hypothetical protein